MDKKVKALRKRLRAERRSKEQRDLRRAMRSEAAMLERTVHSKLAYKRPTDLDRYREWQDENRAQLVKDGIAGRLRCLGDVACVKSPNLFNAAQPGRDYRPFLRIASGEWVRDITNWRPKKKSAYSRLDHLVHHLLVEYEVPGFLYSVFTSQDRDTLNSDPTLFNYLARGGSMVKACKGENPLMPVPLTKRMCRIFLRTPSGYSVVGAARRAQVFAYGGDQRVVDAVVSSRYGEEIHQDESFWATVIQWVCNQTMLNPGQIPHILDWVLARFRQAPAGRPFSMKGRTAPAVLRDIETWQGELFVRGLKDQRSFSSCGLTNGYYTYEKKMDGGAILEEKVCILELLSSSELYREGRKMHHCVGSYVHAILHGDTSIWSMRRGGVRTLTIEVRNRRNQIVQIAGNCNRRPSGGEMVFIKKWALENGLSIGQYIRVV